MQPIRSQKSILTNLVYRKTETVAIEVYRKFIWQSHRQQDVWTNTCIFDGTRAQLYTMNFQRYMNLMNIQYMHLL